jgi:hypothetical protein
MVRFASPEAFVRNQVAGSPLASHVAQGGEAALEALVREVSIAMQAYVADEGIAFPIEGHTPVARGTGGDLSWRIGALKRRSVPRKLLSKQSHPMRSAGTT